MISNVTDQVGIQVNLNLVLRPVDRSQIQRKNLTTSLDSTVNLLPSVVSCLSYIFRPQQAKDGYDFNVQSNLMDRQNSVSCLHQNIIVTITIFV